MKFLIAVAIVIEFSSSKRKRKLPGDLANYHEQIIDVLPSISHTDTDGIFDDGRHAPVGFISSVSIPQNIDPTPYVIDPHLGKPIKYETPSSKVINSKEKINNKEYSKNFDSNSYSSEKSYLQQEGSGKLSNAASILKGMSELKGGDSSDVISGDDFKLTGDKLDQTNLGSVHLAGMLDPETDTHHLDPSLMMGESNNPGAHLQHDNYRGDLFNQYMNHVKESEYWRNALTDPDEKLDQVSLYTSKRKKKMKANTKKLKLLKRKANKSVKYNKVNESNKKSRKKKGRNNY